VQGRFSPAVEAQRLPGSLLERFGGDEPTRLVKLLCFLAPLTSSLPHHSRDAADPQKMRLSPSRCVSEARVLATRSRRARNKEKDPERWARLRFSIVGPLLAAPPAAGELRRELQRLSAKTWRHPLTGAPVRFSFATIERWYYVSRETPHGIR
jgi:hypothetical protein